MAAADVSGTVRIEGLRQFVKALNAVGDKYPDELKKANYELASAVKEAASLRAKARGGVAAKAANSLRANRGANAATISGGGARYPFFYGAEFGALRYRQFKVWRGNQWMAWDGGPGYFLHPAIREEARELIDNYMKRLEELHAEAFPDS